MKRKILFCTSLFMCSICCISVFAQIEVQTSGNVVVTKKMAIGTTVNNNVSLNISHLSNSSTSPYYGIKSHIMTWSSMPTSPIYAVYGFADASASNSNYPINPIIGVCGKAMKTAGAIAVFSAGVAGLAHNYGGIGVYGSITSDLSVPTSYKGGAYAGYFDGNVKVSGTLTATSFSVSSDYRLKENIFNLDPSIISVVNNLRPVSYTYRQDSTNIVYGEAEKEMKITHYGLIAQEVQRLFPNLVYEGGDGYLSVNYVELIPILIMSVQELSGEVKSLTEQLEAIKKDK